MSPCQLFPMENKKIAVDVSFVKGTKTPAKNEVFKQK